MVVLGKEEGVKPMLMLAEKAGNEETREFFDLSNGSTHSKSFPELVGKQCLGVGIPGWIFTADDYGNMNLFHLDTHARIELPHMDTLEGFNPDHERGWCEYYVGKAVLSSDPHQDDEDDYILMLMQGVPWSLAYWRPGKMGFTTIITPTRKAAYKDVTWYDGQFYAVDSRGNIVIVNFRESREPNLGRVIKGIPSDHIVGVNMYIVHSCGELWVITRSGVITNPEIGTYGVEDFYVYKIDVENEIWEDVEDLGNRALFVGFSATLAVDLDIYAIHGCKPDRKDMIPE